jgi:hypothetical protein
MRLNTTTTLVMLGIGAAACTSDGSGSNGPAEGKIGASSLGLGLDQCESVSSEVGWRNDFIPQASVRFLYFFEARPHEASGGPVDAVVGFSNGPADAFTDLGPIVRFNVQGFIDARNGSTYAAYQPFPYRADGTSYQFGIDVNVATRTYGVFVYELGQPNWTGKQIANDFAFRSEQGNLGHIDNVARILDSPASSLEICNFNGETFGNWVVSEAGTGWGATPFPSRSGNFRAEVEAWADLGTDGVLGLSETAAARFSDLAAILRFNPDGIFDARNGGTYQADVHMFWQFSTRYLITFDVDVTAKTYSVTVSPWGTEPSTRIATNYKFRTEQQSIGQLGSLGQFVDGSQGFLASSNLKVSY